MGKPTGPPTQWLQEHSTILADEATLPAADAFVPPLLPVMDHHRPFLRSLVRQLAFWQNRG